jgi:hypothetical protein
VQNKIKKKGTNRMFRIILATVLVASSASAGVITNSIKELTPSIEAEEARKLAVVIESAANKHSVDWRVLVAILKQESNFNLEAVNYETRDYGIGQINYRNIKRLEISLAKLLTDLEYAVETTAKFIAENCNKYGKLDYSTGRKCYTRYHSFTPSQRDKYALLLKGHLNVIEKVVQNERRKQYNTATSKGNPSKSSIPTGKSDSGYIKRAKYPSKDALSLAGRKWLGRREEEA